MLSKIAAIGFVSEVLADTYSAGIYTELDDTGSWASDLSCKDCLLAGKTFCMNTAWFYF